MEFKEQAREPFFSSQTFGRILLFFALLFGSAVLQSSLFPATGLLPATPDLLLSAVLGLAIYDGERSGAVCGITAGVLAEALGGTGVMLLPLFYMLTGYVCGVMSHLFLGKNFPSWLVYSLIACSLRGAMTLIYLVATENGLNMLIVFRQTIIPELIVSYIFSVPMYFLTRICARPFHKQLEMT